jgi:hypothetical protein
MEIAPILLILPAIWLYYRPPLRLWPLLVGGALTLLIWYPYLQFEYGRNFVDLKSQLLLQNLLPANYKDTWCDPSLALGNWDASSTLNFESNQTECQTAPRNYYRSLYILFSYEEAQE